MMKSFLTTFFALLIWNSAAAQVRYQQDFENGFQDMILIDNDGNTPAAQVSSFTAPWNVRGDLLGNAAVSVSWYDPAGKSDDWMITPVISGITQSTILEWDARAFEPSTPDGYKVLVSVGGTDIADFTDQIFQIDGEVANGAFYHRYVFLDDYAGQNIHLAFVNTANNQYLLAVDNIVVRAVRNVDAALLKVNLDTYVRTGIANNVRYTIKNDGFQTLDTMVVNWSDGIQNFSETLTGLDLAFGEVYEGVFTQPFTAFNSDEYQFTFNIASVGSHPDEQPDNNSATAISAGVTTVVPRRVVAEEGTGTWCGWCPRGAVFMEKMHQTYPDLFIPIAIHNGPSDPMTNDAYNDAFSAFFNYPGYPCIALDRKIVVDPKDIEASFQDLLQVVAPVAVTLHTSLDSLSRKLYINGEITTYTDRTNAKLNLVLVLAENDVRGTSNGYRQTNYYAGGNEGVMGGFELLGNPVPASQMRYDFVGRQLLQGFNGLSGVVPATFHENDAFGFNAAYVVLAAYDMDQLYVVAMVVDGNSGVVLNAAQSAAITTTLKEAIPELGSLHIYPNPAHTTSLLDVELTEAAPVTLELQNQLGQTVWALDNGKLPAGHALLQLPMVGLPAGLYTVKMTIAGKALLRKLLVE